MNKYLVKQDESVQEFSNLFDAYSSIDNDAIFLNLREYIETKLINVKTCDDFINTVNSLQAFSKLISAQIQTKFNIQDISQVFVLTTGSSDKVASKNIIVLENNHFISRFNALLNDLGYNAIIEKNDTFIHESIKSYFMNHLQEFLTIAEELIIRDYNISFTKWKQARFLSVDESISYNANYNSQHKYQAIINNEMNSADEYTVLNEFISHIDEIINLILNNKNNLKSIFSRDITSLIY